MQPQNLNLKTTFHRTYILYSDYVNSYGIRFQRNPVIRIAQLNANESEKYSFYTFVKFQSFSTKNIVRDPTKIVEVDILATI